MLAGRKLVAILVVWLTRNLIYFLICVTITKFYYLHSYSANPVWERSVIASTTYGGNVITAAVQTENVFGTQFHPEKADWPDLIVEILVAS